ncbi:LolA family protein [Marinisporobacter balticus]|uniref:Outer membrane lipoprotein-sorting protein n=1 Tax=Marinisporobacter balticus TaxID=2018667 RepID=A0A4R2KKY8_9FIRM|nr:outer-membrane lipoprotein carrier protein LolA [Marinisporobacter balticus]TCO73157.1 outer membrane lipoprotein-sorting protein [Marinisporobacter balticus]
MKIRNIIGSILLLLLIAGCAPKTEQDLFYEVQKKLNKMESYSCQIEITSIGNKTPRTYKMQQWFEKPNKYKLEVTDPESLKGKITISNGNKAWIYHPEIEQVWEMKDFASSEEKNMFLGYFIKNCLNSENVDMIMKNLENEKYLVLDTDIPGNYVYFHKERLWVHVDSMKPYLLQVFDTKGEKRIEVKYNTFEYNPKLGNDFFQLTQSH